MTIFMLAFLFISIIGIAMAFKLLISAIRYHKGTVAVFTLIALLCYAMLFLLILL
jgi:hypothetical protein